MTIGEYLLPAWLSAFRRAHPAVRPQLEITNSTGVPRPCGRIDARSALSKDSTRSTACNRSSSRETMIVVAVAATHPWAKRRSLAPKELLADSYLTREAASGTRAVATAALAGADIHLRPALQAASAQSLKRALEGGGFTLISRLAIEAEQRAGTLAGVSVRGVDLTRELRAVRGRSRSSGPALALWRWLSGTRS